MERWKDGKKVLSGKIVQAHPDAKEGIMIFLEEVYDYFGFNRC